MTISTKKNTFIKFWFHSFSRTSVTFVTNSKIFVGFIKVMKFKRPLVSAITTYLTFSSFVFDCHGFDFASAFCNRFNQSFATIGVFSSVWCHAINYNLPHKRMFTGDCSTAELSRNIKITNNNLTNIISIIVNFASHSTAVFPPLAEAISKYIFRY